MHVFAQNLVFITSILLYCADMKLKLNQTRTYDVDGFRQRAACLCFRAECESEVLLVSSSRHHHMWVVPGGGLEPGESPETTAVREVHEEAGVVGKLGRLLDVFENKDRMTRTYVYTLVVENLTDDYEDRNEMGRLRRWFSLEDAIAKMKEHKPVQLQYFEKLCDNQQDMLFSNRKLAISFFVKDHRQKSSHCHRSCNHNGRKLLPHTPMTLATSNGCQACKECNLHSTCKCHSQSVEFSPQGTHEGLCTDEICLTRTASSQADIRASLWAVVDGKTRPANTIPAKAHPVVSTS